MMREVKLPSGAVLKVTPSPFAVAKTLYQAILKESRSIQIEGIGDVVSTFKELVCVGFSSPIIEAALWECFKRCTYNYGAGDFKIDDQTFEPVERREDYAIVCIEVAKENVLPFGKSLYAEFQRFTQTVASTQA